MLKMNLLALTLAASSVSGYTARDIQSPVISERTLSVLSNKAFWTSHNHRKLDEDEEEEGEGDDAPKMSCDGALMGCMGNEVCLECFTELKDYEIDWASVAADTPCAEVAAFLHEEDRCKALKGDSAATSAFCKTFHSCAFWTSNDDDGEADDGGEEGDEPIACEKLTECNWDGIHQSFIGDGTCHENLYGECYNTAVCGWDGGDCCIDTCRTGANSYVKCGDDGYACRDPDSEYCDSEYTLNCRNYSDDDEDESSEDDLPDCGKGEKLYRLVMYDSFGDGWDGTIMVVKKQSGSEKEVFKGTLVEGAQSTEYICLEPSEMCYDITLTGGVWGKEVSWDIRGFSEASKAIASGGAPTQCHFSVDSSCDNTCYGKPDFDPTNDPEYKDYKSMYNCIKEQCVIQLGACSNDEQCRECLKDIVDDNCHSDEAFNAVLDCTMCQCTDRKGDDFCTNRASPGIVIPSKESSAKRKDCTPGEVLKGGAAVLDYASCTDFDSIGVMVTNFDQNDFGDLDRFESCAHRYEDDPGHGGKTALECLQILKDARDGVISDETSKTVTKETVAALAGLVYDDGENFCDCSKRASEDCPLCPSFKHFKTLLYESLDACMALDEIDCPAWGEFYQGCQKKHGDFKFAKDSDECQYVADGCDGVGPFPAFRRLDCYKEVSSQAWDFYEHYQDRCSDVAPATAPATTPATAPASIDDEPLDTPVTAPVTAPTPVSPKGPVPYVPSDERDDDDGGKSGYVPHDDDGDKPKKHRFRNFVVFCCLCGVGYYCYKKRQEGFSFQSFRQRGFGHDEGMYHGLSMESSFEPAHLPPPPSVMGGSYNMGYNANNNMGGGGYYNNSGNQF